MIAWFEIPVSDMDRAITFYTDVLGVKIHKQDINGLQMGWFMPADEQGPPLGSLMLHESYTPGTEGVLIYFSNPDISGTLEKVGKAGGSVFMPKTQISEEYGFMGVFIDSEGNRIALHSSS